MKKSMAVQTDLFGIIPIRCEYYPALLLNAAGRLAVATIHQLLVERGVAPSQLVKLPHVSIDGLVCLEDDELVINKVRALLLAQPAVLVEFGELSYYTNKGALTIILKVKPNDFIEKFNKEFVAKVGRKVINADLHLTLARNVKPELWDRFKDMDVSLRNSLCSSVAIYKKEHKSQERYQIISEVNFGSKI